MDIKGITLNDIALSIYELNESEDTTTSTAESYKKLQNNILKEFHDHLSEKMKYEEFEKAFNLCLQYGEFKGQEKYIEGFMAGIKIYKSLNEL